MGSLVERTRAPSSAREEADPIAKSLYLVSTEEGRCGPLGPQNRFLFSGLSLQDWRTDWGENSEEEEEQEEKGLVLREYGKREEHLIRVGESMALSGCICTFAFLFSASGSEVFSFLFC